MLSPNKTTFLLIWPKCFITLLGVIEILAVIMFFLTELCSVAANFWTTNVFAGGWCGFIVLIHAIALFVAALCSPGPSAAFRAALITILVFIACAALISFDAVFIVKPTTCILTSSCATNAASTTIFTYDFRQSFFKVFNSWDAFKSYSESQVKLLCQSIQLGLGALCIISGIIYLIIYFECLRRLKKHQQVAPNPFPKPEDYNGIQESNISLLSRYPSAQSPPPITPGQVYMNAPPQQPLSQLVYMMPPPSQPVYMPPPPHPVYMPPPSLPHQQVYMPPPPPSQVVYYPPPPPVAPPQYHGPPPPPQYHGPPPPLQYPQLAPRPAPYAPQVQPGVRPWYAHRNN